ncbi:helix-turn-helix domain-containing protein [Candidatus Clostridium radicumherbarum]|uniref:Helix-turn-helix domain-containing protein n=1 Tax=Candidatus Clostridium radicumherbarum TaxID=3381662 RepID=A0ABW8TYQ6_9CLOT
MDYRKLGKRIKEERLKKNLTQEQLAEIVNVSSVYVSHIENASTKPSLETLVNLSNALDVTPDFLLFDSLHKSSEYIKDEISALLQSCNTENLRLITRLIKAVIED